jgi:predicted phosphate transport protein (TIGR00153 family)
MGLLERARIARRRRTARAVFWREAKVFELLAKAGANLRRSGECIHELLVSWPEDRGLVAELARAEELGDQITREIIIRLHRGRLAGFDRGGVHALAAAIDDVVDEIQETAEELATYGIEAPLAQAQQLGSVLRDSARVLGGALEGLTGFDELAPHAQRMRELEHEGDQIYREALASLFEGGIDPMVILRWKDVLQGLEDAIDRMCQAMDILSGLVTKYS